ncbi:hypothetical protein ACFX2F_013374 [Malus domestica]
MGSKGSHNTENDTLLAPSAKQRKKEGKTVTLEAKVDELEAQNNKIAMKNEVLQEQYESSLRCSTKLGILKHASSLPLRTSTIIRVPHNTEGHLPPTWVSLMRSESIIKRLINMRLLSTQMLQPKVEEVEEDTSLQKGWKDRKLFIVTAKTS